MHRSFVFAAAAACLLAASVIAQPACAQPAQASEPSPAPSSVLSLLPSPNPAPDSDYPAFRALNVPFHLVEVVGAVPAYLMVTEAGADPDAQARARKAGAAFVQDLSRHPDDIIDPMMHDALTRFSHDEVVRLGQLCARPALDRVQTQLLAALRREDPMPNGASMNSLLAADPDFATWSKADQALMERFAEIVLGSVTEAEGTMEQAERVAKEAGAKAG